MRTLIKIICSNCKKEVPQKSGGTYVLGKLYCGLCIDKGFQIKVKFAAKEVKSWVGSIGTN